MPFDDPSPSDDDDGEPAGEPCPACGSPNTDESYGYIDRPPRGGYKLMGTSTLCHECGHEWNVAEDYEVNPCTRCEQIADRCSCGVPPVEPDPTPR